MPRKCISERRKIKVINHLEGVFPQYQPEIGKIYDADYSEPVVSDTKKLRGEFCIIDVRDKKIVLRHGEFELVGC